ncbi:MAG: UvrD-helicase domain-containing protein, partial [Chlamydiota bacterium]
SALKALETGVTDFDYLKKQLEIGPKRAIFCLKNALAFADEMQVFTIHGFCYRMLSEHVFEAEESMELGCPDSSDHKGALRGVVEDFFRTNLHPQQYSTTQLYHLLKKSGHKFSKLISTIMTLLEKNAEIEEFDCFNTLFEKFQNKLLELPHIEKEKFLEDFQKLKICYKQMTNASFETQALLLSAILENKRCSSCEFDLLLKEKELFLEKVRTDNLKVRAKSLELHYKGLFEWMRDEILPFINEGKDPALLGMRIARSCQMIWNEKKGKTLPDELLQKMSNCLDNPLFIERVQKKYLSAIIDEFQDTDPLQWDILERLFLKKIKAFYLVGDPKQSIYAFRSADVKTYKKAKLKIDVKNLAFLDTNYRSDPALVHALNELFLFSPAWLDCLDMMRVFAGKKETVPLLDFDRGRVHFFIAESVKGRSKSWPTTQMEEDLFFPFITQEIQSLKGSPSCAVLVKDRFQAKRMQEFLEKWNIRAIVKRSQSLVDSESYIALRDLLFAVRDPRDFSLIRRALAGPLFGWTAEEVKEALHDPRFEKIKTLFHQWHHLLITDGFGKMMGSFFSECSLEKSWSGAFRQWVELLLTEPQDPFCFLEEMERENIDEEERLKLREEDEEGKVLIMTTHVSKGLEFDFVFALGIASRHEQKEEYVKINNKLVKFNAEDRACQEVLKEQSEEKLRQFYVALTRAKQRVYVALARDIEGSPANAPCELFCENLGPDMFQALNTLKQTADISYSKLEESNFMLTMQEAIEAEPLPPLPEGRVPGTPFFLSSFSSLAKKKSQESVEVKEGDLPPGAETGHLLHKIIERVFSSSQDLMEVIQEEIDSTPLVGWEDKILEMISPLLDHPLQIEDGKYIVLKNIPKECIFQEMEFLFPREGNRIKGFIDLTFIHEGKYYFIDWKSNLLPDYSTASLEKVMHACDYFLQASIYAEALKRYFENFSLECGGAFYIFLRGPAVYTILPEHL